MSETGPACREDVLTSPDGVRVARYLWLPEGGGRPRAVVQIAHGAAEHARRYDRFARHLAGRGFAVLAGDHRGHGRTAASTGGYGKVGAEGWRGTLWDMKTMAEGVRSAYPKVPIVLFGHSMGSVLARDFAQDRGEMLAGLILSGAFRSLPGVDPEGDAEALKAVVAEQGRDAESDFLSRAFRSFNEPFEHRTGYEWLSRDPAEVDRYVEDEACGFPFSAGLMLDWLRAQRRVNDPGRMGRVPTGLPVHVVSGAEDPLHQRLTLLHELLEDFRYRGSKDLTWRVYEGARHELLNEVNREEVEEGIGEWLEKRF